jgi:hypothetical protein
MRTLFFLGIVLFASTGYAGEWVAVNRLATKIVVQSPPVTYVVPQPVVVNRWIPYYYSPTISIYGMPVIETHRRFFFRRERLLTYPARVSWYERSSLYYGY